MNIIALAQALFYLLSVPVHLAVRVNGLSAGAGISVFERRFARRRAEDDLTASKPKGKGPDVRHVLRVLRRLKIDRLELAGRISLGDAAATALVCGGLNGLVWSLRGRVGRVKADVKPDFAAEGVVVELCGMIRARSGQIILATLQIWTEEAFSWISTRLKT